MVIAMWKDNIGSDAVLVVMGRISKSHAGLCIL